MAIKITVSNHKGGIGKTTTAINLATGLALKKKKVLLIDTEIQCNSTRVYDAKIDDTATIADMLYNGTLAEECIQHTNLGDIIASDPALKNADTQIPVDVDRFYHLKDACKNLDDMYDYIICDTPPGNGVILGNVLAYVDYIIIPVTCDAFGIQGLHDFATTVNSFKERINNDLSIAGILKVMYKGRRKLTRDIEDDILPELAKNMDTKIFKTCIRDSVKCQEAQTVRRSLYEYAPKCNTAIDYSEFIKELSNTIRRKK